MPLAGAQNVWVLPLASLLSCGSALAVRFWSFGLEHKLLVSCFSPAIRCGSQFTPPIRAFVDAVDLWPPVRVMVPSSVVAAERRSFVLNLPRNAVSRPLPISHVK
ncbi:hypothetical protein PIB30_054404 [Stylosanthes scabra]|uniref:Secreted protein n=1 Tax=Stylosanthes scabra TaxID=79078 RepID=A0ABU6WM50_9FABA|nr:hypothetical protein [Stylosanthes scabra]